MSSFAVAARTITVAPHDGADVLEIARVDGTDFTSVIRKGEFRSGDVVLYIPTAAVVPQEILERMGLWGAQKVSKQTGQTRVIGRLAGPDGSRVKAVRLRGVLSEGLCLAPPMEVTVGECYAEVLGIEKWRPPVPACLDGLVEPCAEIRPYTDIENFKYFPDVFAAGEDVIATEKVHGTCSLYSLIGEQFVVTSKGQAGKGLVLLRDADEHGTTKNTYWRIAERFDIENVLRTLRSRLGAREITLFGETFGSPIQDLAYGRQGEMDFRAFDLRVDGRYLDHDDFTEIIGAHEFNLVLCPVLYRGPYDVQALDEVRDGTETISGQGRHVREGVIVRPVRERQHERLGRVILKHISPAYLTRKNATEFE